MQATEVTQDEFVTAHTSGAPVVDVRSPEEYAAGHVPGAVNIPLEQVEARRAEFTADLPMHVICQPRECNDTHKITETVYSIGGRTFNQRKTAGDRIRDKIDIDHPSGSKATQRESTKKQKKSPVCK